MSLVTIQRSAAHLFLQFFHNLKQVRFHRPPQSKDALTLAIIPVAYIILHKDGFS